MQGLSPAGCHPCGDVPIGSLLRTKLTFDQRRSGGGLRLSQGRRRATQRQPKDWGTAACAQGMAPGSGVYSWLVALDQCEKGHVFVGAVSAAANRATYVGGDKHGWGVIGTGALWHAKARVRSDYCEGFTTGSVVVATLDTDEGTLSFRTPKRDWGVAFEGLPKETLYAAVGLYQARDSVRIAHLSHTGGGTPGGTPTPTPTPTPQLLAPAAAARAREPLDALADRVLGAVARARQLALRADLAPAAALDHPTMLSLLAPALAAANLLGAQPLHPAALAGVAARLLAPLAGLLGPLEALVGALGPDAGAPMGGTWRITSAASDAIPAQTYYLRLERAPSEGGVGSAFVGSSLPAGPPGPAEGAAVSVAGAAIGRRVRFIEAWRSRSQCLIEGRLSLDGGRFWGLFQDLRSGSAGTVCGTRVAAGAPPAGGAAARGRALLQVLALATGRMAAALHAAALPVGGPPEEPGAGEHKAPAEESPPAPVLEAWLQSPLLRGGLAPQEVLPVLRASAAHYFGPRGAAPRAAAAPLLGVLEEAIADAGAPAPPAPAPREAPLLQEVVAGRGLGLRLDEWVLRHVGRDNLLRLGGESMREARRHVLGALLYQSGSLALVDPEALEGGDRPEEDAPPGVDKQRPPAAIQQVWRASLRVVEWAVRTKRETGAAYTHVAEGVIARARFLLSVMPCAAASAAPLQRAVSLQRGLASSASGSALASATALGSDQTSMLSEATSFLEDAALSPAALPRLRALIAGAAARCLVGTAGLRCVALLLGGRAGGAAPPKGGTPPPPPPPPPPRRPARLRRAAPGAARRPGAVPARYHLPSVSELGALGGGLSSGAAARLAAPPEGGYPRGPQEYPPGHLLHGSACAGRWALRRARASLEDALEAAARRMQRSLWGSAGSAADLGCALTALWTSRVSAEEHALLSRLGVFRILQQVLDENRLEQNAAAQAALAAAEGEGAGGGEGCSAADAEALRLCMASAACRRLVQGSLRLVHLLATQIAAGGDEGPGAAPPLEVLRQPSGPDTLSRALFDMLYAELLVVLQAAQPPPPPAALEEALVTRSARACLQAPQGVGGPTPRRGPRRPAGGAAGELLRGGARPRRRPPRAAWPGSACSSCRSRPGPRTRTPRARSSAAAAPRAAAAGPRRRATRCRSCRCSRASSSRRPAACCSAGPTGCGCSARPSASAPSWSRAARCGSSAASCSRWARARSPARTSRRPAGCWPRWRTRRRPRTSARRPPRPAAPSGPWRCCSTSRRRTRCSRRRRSPAARAAGRRPAAPWTCGSRSGWPRTWPARRCSCSGSCSGTRAGGRRWTRR